MQQRKDENTDSENNTGKENNNIGFYHPKLMCEDKEINDQCPCGGRKKAAFKLILWFSLRKPTTTTKMIN